MNEEIEIRQEQCECGCCEEEPEEFEINAESYTLSCGTTEQEPNICKKTGEELCLCVTCAFDNIKLAEQIMFQKKMLNTIPDGMSGITAWKLAEKINPKMWENYASHGGMISSLTRAGWRLQEMGLIIRLPAKDQWGEARYIKKEIT